MLFQPIYIPRALNTGTCSQQGDLFYSAGLHRNRYYQQLAQEKLGRGFEKNAGGWTGRVEISKEEIPGSKRSMHGNSLTYSSFLKGEPLSSVLSSDGNFNFCIRSSPLRAGAAYNNSKPKQKEGKYTLQLTLAFHSFPPDTHSCLSETMSPNCLASCMSFFLAHDAGGFSGADWASIAKNFVTHVSQW